ncbi:DNA polymerase IV [Portibacter lacus]|uniref:DNA polymerase IV n=1 Tax=Portibacter lacus TaxID=1099794 RepID=A0AA37SXM3_9BACT|nr:DNA polymerase IV [Portibacter lacus]GLR19715.1 DNA polymerase IV [Portibacter lacus]
MYNRAVLHLDLDSFFVSVECLKNSDFIGKPLLIGGSSNRGVVASCSYEARRFGIHSAMPMKMARRLCPHAIILKGDMDSYSYHSKVVTDIIAEDAPIFEKASIDEFYLDLSGMDKYFGCLKWSVEMRKRIIDNSGLPISFGLSVNKLVSKVGTGEGKPNGEKAVPVGEEKNFLAPLSTKKIPGVGKEMYKKLSFMGVRSIKTLSEIPQRLLEREFGKSGRSLWNKANAIDNSPVVPYSEKKSISKERTFTEDTLDLQMIKSLLMRMVEELAFELRDSEKLCSCITVKIRYADFNTYTKQKRITYTANDHFLIDTTKELFNSLYERRQLIRLVGVRFSGLVHGKYQISLFEDSEKHIRLLQEMDQLRKRFGKDAVKLAHSIGRNHRLEHSGSLLAAKYNKGDK